MKDRRNSQKLFGIFTPVLLFGVFQICLAQAFIVAKDNATTENFAEHTFDKSNLSLYFNAETGLSLPDIIAKALESNDDLKAARLEINKAGERFKQAGARPGPTFDFEQKTGRFSGSSGESETSFGLSLPFEIAGQRQKRMTSAKIEIELAETRIKIQERMLIAEITVIYIESLKLLSELRIIEKLLENELETVRKAQARVNEGDVAPLDLNIFQADAERLRLRKNSNENKLQILLAKLKFAAGFSSEESLLLREDIQTAKSFALSDAVPSILEQALKNRPELRFWQLSEEASKADLDLVKANSAPDLTAYTKFSTEKREDFPLGTTRENALSFGVSIGLPYFRRNRAKETEAVLNIEQVRLRRDFAEKQIKAEVIMALQSLKAADEAIPAFETRVLARSEENLKAILAAYQIGEFDASDVVTARRKVFDVNIELNELYAERYRALTNLRLAGGFDFRQK